MSNVIKNIVILLDLQTILEPIKKAIVILKHKSVTFVCLRKLTVIIKEFPQSKGSRANTFQIICKKALCVWKSLGNSDTSANKLIAQLSNYSLKIQPYDFEFCS
nr:8749_t:CDS:2 [Entrophospora candida]